MKKIVIAMATLLCAAGCENATTFHASCSKAEKGYTCLNDGVYVCEDQGDDQYVWQKTNIKCEDICNENENSTKCGERDELYRCEKYDDYEFYIWKPQEQTCSAVCQKLGIIGCGTLGGSPTGYTCHDNELIPCSNDVSCKSGGICGECQNGKTECDGNKIRKCNNGEWSPFVECDSGTTCQNHECIPVVPECSTDDDCGQGKICNGGKCTEIQGEPKCSTNADCGEGQICLNGKCKQNSNVNPCITCKPPNQCVDGKCMTPCDDPSLVQCKEQHSNIPQKCINGFWEDEEPCRDGMSCKDGVCESSTETETCMTGYISCINNTKCDNNEWMPIEPDWRHSIICNYCKEKTFSGISYECGDAIFTCREENHYTVKGQSNSDDSIKKCETPCLNNEKNEITCIQDNPKSVCIGQDSYTIDSECYSIFSSKQTNTVGFTTGNPEPGCYEYSVGSFKVHNYYIKKGAVNMPYGKHEIKYCPYGCTEDGCHECHGGNCESKDCKQNEVGTYRCSDSETPQMCSNPSKKWTTQMINLLVFNAKNKNDIWILTLSNVCYYGGSGDDVSLKCTLQETQKGTLENFMNDNENTVLFKPTGNCNSLVDNNYTIYIKGLNDYTINSKEHVLISEDLNKIKFSSELTSH